MHTCMYEYLADQLDFFQNLHVFLRYDVSLFPRSTTGQPAWCVSVHVCSAHAYPSAPRSRSGATITRTDIVLPAASTCCTRNSVLRLGDDMCRRLRPLILAELHAERNSLKAQKHGRTRNNGVMDMVVAGGAASATTGWRSSDRERCVHLSAWPFPSVASFSVEGVDGVLLVPACLAHRLRKDGSLFFVSLQVKVDNARTTGRT